jgi:anti-sigma factor RsiW
LRFRRRLTCRELVELITDYLEGDLPPREHARFERHVAGCPGCQAYLDQMRATLAVLGRLGTDDLPPPARAPMLEAFRRWTAG